MQLVSRLTNKGNVTRKLCRSCVQSEHWLVKKENETVLQQAEMRMIRWMGRVKATDRVTCSELRETGTDYITSDTVKLTQMVRTCFKKR